MGDSDGVTELVQVVDIRGPEDGRWVPCMVLWCSPQDCALDVGLETERVQVVAGSRAAVPTICVVTVQKRDSDLGLDYPVMTHQSLLRPVLQHS